MKTKVCGLNPTRDVQLCIDLQVNYLGFVFYEKSPRNVNISDINTLSTYDKKNCAFVAVTVDPSDELIKKKILYLLLPFVLVVQYYYYFFITLGFLERRMLLTFS